MMMCLCVFVCSNRTCSDLAKLTLEVLLFVRFERGDLDPRKSECGSRDKKCVFVEIYY